MKGATDKDALLSMAKKILAKATPSTVTGDSNDLWQIGLTKVFLKESQVVSAWQLLRIHQ